MFVDDLHRCLPDKAIQVLEAIKLFLDEQNCIFVIGIDQYMIAYGIEAIYKEIGNKVSIDGMQYLEKLVQLPFHIPPVGQSDADYFVRSLEVPSGRMKNVQKCLQ